MSGPRRREVPAISGVPRIRTRRRGRASGWTAVPAALALVGNLALLPASCAMMAAGKPDLRLHGHVCPRLCPIGSASCSASMPGHHGDGAATASHHGDDVASAAAGHHGDGAAAAGPGHHGNGEAAPGPRRHENREAAAGNHGGDADAAACHCDKLGGDHSVYLVLGGAGVAILAGTAPPEPSGAEAPAPPLAEPVPTRAVTPVPRPPNA